MIETARIKLIPLTYGQLIKYINCDLSLEKELNLNHSNRSISPELREALEATILPCVADKSKNYLFSTLWTVVDKEHNRMVADVCFKGEPNKNGEIELGYGTYEDYQGKGYITEAIKAISEWAFNQPNVKVILAETDKNNLASIKVLQKNKFIKTNETETSIFWELKKL